MLFTPRFGKSPKTVQKDSAQLLGLGQGHLSDQCSAKVNVGDDDDENAKDALALCLEIASIDGVLLQKGPKAVVTKIFFPLECATDIFTCMHSFCALEIAFGDGAFLQKERALGNGQ